MLVIDLNQKLPKAVVSASQGINDSGSTPAISGMDNTRSAVLRMLNHFVFDFHQTLVSTKGILLQRKIEFCPTT